MMSTYQQQDISNLLELTNHLIDVDFGEEQQQQQPQRNIPVKKHEYVSTTPKYRQQKQSKSGNYQTRSRSPQSSQQQQQQQLQHFSRREHDDEKLSNESELRRLLRLEKNRCSRLQLKCRQYELQLLSTRNQMERQTPPKTISPNDYKVRAMGRRIDDLKKQVKAVI